MSDIEDNIEMAYWRAINAFASRRSEVLARKVVYRMQRIEASGIFGGDYPFRSLWDEYCHNLQNGSVADFIDDAADDLTTSIIDKVVSDLCKDEADLLAMSDPDWETDPGPRPDLVRKLIREAVDMLASGRNLERFDPNIG